MILFTSKARQTSAGYRVRRPRAARCAAVSVAAALALIAVLPAPAPTTAGFVESEYASGVVSTVTLPVLSTRPSCVTEDVVVIVVIRRDARISWTAPSGGLPAGMTYELRITNTTAAPQITRSVYTSSPTFLLTDGLLSGGLLGGLLTGPATLQVQVYVAIPNSVSTPTSSIWSSLTSPAPRTVQYTGGLLSGNFVCG